MGYVEISKPVRRESNDSRYGTDTSDYRVDPEIIPGMRDPRSLDLSDPNAERDAMYDEQYDMLDELLAEQMALAERQIALAERNAAMADAQLLFYKENFLPVLNDIMDQAKTGIDPDYSAAVAGQMARANAETARVTKANDAARLGVESSDIYDGLDQQAEDAAKTAEVDARNIARRSAVDTTKQLRTEAASMAAGVPQIGTSAFGASADSLAAAAATKANAAAGVNSVMQAQTNAAHQGQMAGNQAQASASQFYADASFANQMAQAQAMNQLYGAAGSLAMAGLVYGAVKTPTAPAATQPAPSAPSAPQRPMDISQPDPYDHALVASGPMW